MNLDNNSTPNVSESSTYIVINDNVITNLLCGEADDIRYFIFGTNDATFESNTNIFLEGSSDFSGAIGDTLTLISDGTKWYELSRSLNPLYMTSNTLDNCSIDDNYLLQQINTLKANISVIQEKVDLIGIIQTNLRIDLYPTMTQTEIQFILNDIPYNVAKGAVITIHFDDGDYDLSEPLYIRNISGDGQVIVTSDDTSGFSHSKSVVLHSDLYFSAGINFVNCDIPIELKNIAFKYAINGTGGHSGGIEVIDCTRIEISDVYIESINNIGNNIYFEKSSGLVKNTLVTAGLSGICANKMSNVSIENCDDYGVMPVYGISAMRGSVISLWDSQRPKGMSQDAFSNKGSVINA